MAQRARAGAKGVPAQELRALGQAPLRGPGGGECPPEETGLRKEQRRMWAELSAAAAPRVSGPDPGICKR